MENGKKRRQKKFLILEDNFDSTYACRCKIFKNFNV